MLSAVLQKQNLKKSKAKGNKTSSFIALFTGILLSSAVAGCSTTSSSQNADNAALGGQLAPKHTSKRANAKTAARAQSAALAYAGHGYSKIGNASWYGTGFQGKRTASGEIFNKYNLTAAHRSMPLPSYARVTNMANGASVIVRVNDRGPFVHSRLIDLSQGAAQLLGYRGTAQVKVDYVGPAPAGGHDEAFLRASYHPAGNSPLPQIQENAGKPLAYSGAASAQPSGEKALEGLTDKKQNKAPANTAGKAKETASAKSEQMAANTANKPAPEALVELGMNMSQAEYDSKAKRGASEKSLHYQSPDFQDN